MKKILINGANSKTGGGRSILQNFLRILSSKDLDRSYVVLVPDNFLCEEFSNKNIHYVTLGSVYTHSLFSPLLYIFVLNIIIRYFRCSAVLNFGDLPILTKSRQVMLFDWPYAVYPESEVWDRMDTMSFVSRRVKLAIFRRFVNLPAIMIAQTEAMVARLENLYRISDVRIVPNAVSLENEGTGHDRDFGLGDGFKLLYLTYYYPHKNLEVFLPLAEEIRRRGLGIKLVLTISSEQHDNAARLLAEVARRNLEQIIVNIGPVEMKDVPSLYRQTDGLLMPTLLESFSGAYVEAMFHGKPIFTSDIDFARAVCFDSAFYFDPNDHMQMLDAIVACINDPQLSAVKVANGKTVLSRTLSWPAAYEKYIGLIEEVL